MSPSPRPEHQVRTLNDAFRAIGPMGDGRWVMTRGVLALGAELVPMVIRKVQAFDAFDPGNDPYGEHDFGSFTLGEDRLFWKIDYYDRSLQSGSADPADPAITARVMTIMLAEEY